VCRVFVLQELADMAGLMASEWPSVGMVCCMPRFNFVSGCLPSPSCKHTLLTHCIWLASLLCLLGFLSPAALTSFEEQ
jgi:hypothetical protein